MYCTTELEQYLNTVTNAYATPEKVAAAVDMFLTCVDSVAEIDVFFRRTINKFLQAWLKPFLPTVRSLLRSRLSQEETLHKVMGLVHEKRDIDSIVFTGDYPPSLLISCIIEHIMSNPESIIAKHFGIDRYMFSKDIETRVKHMFADMISRVLIRTRDIIELRKTIRTPTVAGLPRDVQRIIKELVKR